MGWWHKMQNALMLWFHFIIRSPMASRLCITIHRRKEYFGVRGMSKPNNLIPIYKKMNLPYKVPCTFLEKLLRILVWFLLPFVNIFFNISGQHPYLTNFILNLIQESHSVSPATVITQDFFYCCICTYTHIYTTSSSKYIYQPAKRRQVVVPEWCISATPYFCRNAILQ